MSLLLNDPGFKARLPAMTVVALHQSLEALRAAVGDRMDRTAQPGLHDRLDWFELLLRYCSPAGAPLFVLVEDENGGLVLPLTAAGARGRALANWYTLAWAPVSWGAPANLFLHAASALRRFGVLELGPLEPDEAETLARAFAVAGWRMESRPGKANWVAHVGGMSFNKFWDERPSRLRNTVARKGKKAGLAFDIHRAFDAEAWAAHEEVYAHSWKPEEGSPAFLRALAETEGAAGALRLGIARRGERAVAAQLWLVENGIATIHKLAYREDERTHSPGSLLSAAMFEHVITHDRPQLISYGLGDEPYKADWMDERREMRTLVLRNPLHPVGALSLAKAAVRRLVKRGPGV